MCFAPGWEWATLNEPRAVRGVKARFVYKNPVVPWFVGLQSETAISKAESEIVVREIESGGRSSNASGPGMFHHPGVRGAGDRTKPSSGPKCTIPSVPHVEAGDAQEKHTSIGEARFAHTGGSARNTRGHAGGSLRSTASRRDKRLQDRHHALAARQHHRPAGAGNYAGWTPAVGDQLCATPGCL